MSIEQLTEFFKWNVIWGGGFYILTALAAIAMPEFIYNVQSKFFNLTKKEFDTALYAYVGIFKIVFIVFMIVPYLALLSIS